MYEKARQEFKKSLEIDADYLPAREGLEILKALGFTGHLNCCAEKRSGFRHSPPITSWFILIPMKDVVDPRAVAANQVGYDFLPKSVSEQ
jgi:hypothetical protein